MNTLQILLSALGTIAVVAFLAWLRSWLRRTRMAGIRCPAPEHCAPSHANYRQRAEAARLADCIAAASSTRPRVRISIPAIGIRQEAERAAILAYQQFAHCRVKAVASCEIDGRYVLTAELMSATEVNS